MPSRPIEVSALVLGILGCALPASAQLLPPPPPATPPSQPGAQPVAPGQPGAPAPGTSPGLAPPPPVAVPSEERETLRQLEQADREDAGRGLQFFWLAPEAGFQFAALDALSNSDLIDERVKAGSGLGFGGTVGLRWLYFTGSARFRYGMLSEFALWTLVGEFGLRIPLGSFEPYALAGVGFARASGFADGALGELGVADDARASGIAARLGGGFDYYVTPVFSTGVGVDAEALFLSRDAFATDSDTIYDASGSGIGIAVSAVAVLGLHF